MYVVIEFFPLHCHLHLEQSGGNPNRISKGL